MRKRTVIAVASASLTAAVVGLLLLSLDPHSDASPRAAIWGCDKRIGAVVEPPGHGDTTIGPVAFKDLPQSYRYSSRHPRTPIKAVAVLRPGARVTLAIPLRQRDWLSMGYGAGRSGKVSLQACRHFRSRRARRSECGNWDHTACISGPTLFSGGFGVRFRQAPRRGRCAELIAWVKGEDQPLRRYLFDPDPGACADGPPVEASCDAGGVAPTEVVPERDAVVGPLVLLAGRQTVRHRPGAFNGNGYKLPATLPEGTAASLSVPQRLRGHVGLVYSLRTQDRVWMRGVEAADTTVRFTACAPEGEPGRTGWPGGLVVDRRRCATLIVTPSGGVPVRGRVPLGRRC